MSAAEQNYKGRTAYRINEVSEMFGISRSTIYAMMNDGRLGYTVFCGIRFIEGSDIPGLGVSEDSLKVRHDKTVNSESVCD